MFARLSNLTGRYAYYPKQFYLCTYFCCEMSKSVALGNKLIILREIRDSKDVLFGSFSDKLTKKDKIECWKAIHEKCVSLGLVAPNKEWTYSRDVFWQNLKKGTMKKVDNRKKTGSAGGTDCKYTDIDRVILDIVGPDNPIICSLGVSDTWEQGLGESNSVLIDTNINSNPCTKTNDQNQSPNKSSELVCANLVSTGCTNVTENSNKKKRSNHTDDLETAEKTLMELKKKKLLCQIEILEKESYLKTLEILKQERELQIAASKYTEPLNSVTYIINVEGTPTEGEEET